MEPIIDSVINEKCVYFSIEDDEVDNNNFKFSRDLFFKFSNINLEKFNHKSYVAFDSKDISLKSKEYLKLFFSENTIYIGIELTKEFRDLLDEIGVIYINFWFHPFHLFDDIVFLINTNSKQIYTTLKKFEISKSEFKFAALYWQTQLRKSRNVNFPEIPDGAVLFIGQSLTDSSVKLGNKYLSILDYKNRIENLIQENAVLIYSEHPSRQRNREIEAYIEQNSKIIKTTRPTYSLLSSPKIKKVVSLSSSVLFESQFFDNKEIEYLFKPQFDIGGDFENGNSFVSIKDHYFSSIFWYEVLKIYFPNSEKKILKTDYLCQPNRLRNIINQWHGYADLDLYKRLELDIKASIRETFSINSNSSNARNLISNNKNSDKKLISLVSNKRYNFNNEEIYKSFILKGFASIENWGVWSNSTIAEIDFQLNSNDFLKENVLEFMFKSYTPFKHKLNIDIYVNDAFYKHIKLSGNKQRKLSLYLKRLESFNKIKFQIMNPASPHSFGISNDKRELGIGIKSFKLKKTKNVIDYLRIFSNKIFENNIVQADVINKNEKKSYEENNNRLIWDKESKQFVNNISKTLDFGINSIGFFKENIGLSHHARYITRSLMNSGIPFCCKHFELNKGDHSNHDFNNYLTTNLIYNINLFSLNAPYVLKYKSFFPDDFNGRYNIGYGAWEFDKFPLSWIEQNNILNEIWATSDFLLETFSRYHTIPVIKMPIPIDFPINNLKKYNRSYFSLPEKKFIFLFTYDIGSDIDGRKNPLSVIESFKRAFKGNDEVFLLIKAAPRTYNSTDNNILNQVIGNDKNILIISKILTDEEMKALMYVCDAYISLHRCEGFGIGMAEAMKLGKPVIATNYSGNLEFMKNHNSCLVNCSLIPATSFTNLVKGHVWADPDIEHATWFMKKLVDNIDYYKKISHEGKKYIDEYHSFEFIGNRIKERLKLLGLMK